MVICTDMSSDSETNVLARGKEVFPSHSISLSAILNHYLEGVGKTVSGTSKHNRGVNVKRTWNTRLSCSPAGVVRGRQGWQGRKVAVTAQQQGILVIQICKTVVLSEYRVYGHS